MKASRAASSFLVLASLVVPSVRRAEACGDKFVRVGRGGRFQRGYVAVHPSAILILLKAGSPDGGALRKLPATLKAAGHEAVTVSTPAALAKALEARRFDIVMAETAELPGVSAAIAGMTPAPEVLAVVARPARYEILVDIDEAMANRR